MGKRYIQLDRTFFDFGPKDHKSDPNTLRAIADLTGKKTDWDALLQSRIVVMLGEAGSGKTWEFREKARSLLQKGDATFFCAIEDLAEGDFETALPGPSDVERFHTWLSRKGKGIFFLDSIDELRLKGHSLNRALRRLGHTLGENLTRAQFLISCRVSDWRAEADRDTIESIISIASKERQGLDNIHKTTQMKVHEHVRIVQLAPLSGEQIKKLADAYGVKETDGFLQAIGQANAWHFAERPRDVEWLVGYWKNNNRLGSLTDLIKQNIDNKLQERNLTYQQNDPLSSGEALKGAAALAVAVTLCKKSNFILPDESIEFDRLPNSLDPQRVLSQWPQKKSEAY